ncbi:MAG: hypothetical protein ACPGVN_00830 [Alphaproteobacteria bacterium]
MASQQFKAPSHDEINTYVRLGRQLQAQAFATSMRKLTSIPAALFRK